MTFSSFSFISFNFYVCASHSLFCLCLVAVMQSLKEHLKERTPSMPVIAVQAIPNDRQETRNTYECPVYKTKLHANTYVWIFRLKTRERRPKWVLAGVALLLSV